MIMYDRRGQLIEVFEDTQRMYRQHPALKEAVAASETVLILAEEYPELPAVHDTQAEVAVTKKKTFEAARENHADHPEWKIAVLNFASATNPGGGVKKGSSAQEESLCRCSTLYPSLDVEWLWKEYYKKNRAAQNNLHTDDCIYSPGVIVFKTDDDIPAVMEESDWFSVDVISCAAPNLRQRPGNQYNPDHGQPVKIPPNELYDLHMRRGRHILQIAAARNVDCLILGAFGCGAFANDPEVVARAYRDILPEYRKYFRKIEFAIYCRPRETQNYDAFSREMEKL